MTRHRSHILSVLLGGAILVTLAFAWVTFAPTRYGGSVDYVSIYGISMEPKLHRGELAVLRPQGSYRVGEVVGYHNHDLNRTVLHRIVRMDGARYVFKGDNNDFEDSYEATRADLVGRLWFDVPQAGSVLSWTRRPSHAALIAGLVTIPLLLAGGAGAAAARRRRGGNLSVPPSLAGLLTPALAALLLFALIEADALRHPTTHAVEAPGAYVQQGEFRYTGHADQGAVYPASTLTTGQTVFSSLVRRVDMGFDYRFFSALPHAMRGTAALDVNLASSLGWSRSLAATKHAFRGDTARLVAPLDVRTIDARLQQYLAETKVSTDTFTLTVTPHVRIRGDIDGKPLNTSFTPTPLTFIVDQAALRLAHPELGGGIGQSPQDQLRPSEPGTMPRAVPSSMHLLVLHPRVTTVRRVALLGLVIAAVFALLSGGALLNNQRRDELTNARRRYRHVLVHVTEPPEGPCISVESFEGLAQIAQNYATVILEHGDTFYAVGDGSTFCYRAGVNDRNRGRKPDSGAAMPHPHTTSAPSS